MYGKEEFIERLREKSFYNTLLEWLEWFSNPDALREIHRRHDDMPDNMPECYVVECAKWYVQTKMCDVQDFVFRKNGMKAEEEVYHYPPYHPGAFLATLYAIFATDPYRWTADDDKFYKLESFMKKNGFMAFYKAIRTIIDRNELPPRPRFASRAAFSIASNRKMDEQVEEPKPGKQPVSTNDNNDSVQLSVLFSQALLNNESNRMAFVKVVRDVVTPKVLDTSGSREAKWKWPHVQQALYDSKHIVTLKNKNEFGRSMSPITGCTATSISQTFKRFDAKDTDANIILAIRKVVDDAIANATKTDIVEKIVKERTEVQTGMNPVLKQLLEPILLLEPYYYPNCTKEMVIEGFQSLSRKYVPEHFVDVEKRIRKTSFNFITALQEVRFIRDNVPALEMGFHLKQLYDDLQPMDICRGLMHSVDERLPESVNMLLTQFRFDMQHVMKTANVRPDEVEMTETVAHSQYIEYLNAKEENLIERLVRKTLCFSSYFQYYVKEQDVWDMYTSMFKEISLVASVHRTFEENRIDTAVCKVVGVLREVGIIKEGVPTRQLAECFTSTGVHYESIRKAITIGFDRDRMLHDYIYDFWMRKYLPD